MIKTRLQNKLKKQTAKTKKEKKSMLVFTSDGLFKGSGGAATSLRERIKHMPNWHFYVISRHFMQDPEDENDAKTAGLSNVTLICDRSFADWGHAIKNYNDTFVFDTRFSLTVALRYFADKTKLQSQRDVGAFGRNVDSSTTVQTELPRLIVCNDFFYGQTAQILADLWGVKWVYNIDMNYESYYQRMRGVASKSSNERYEKDIVPYEHWATLHADHIIVHTQAVKNALPMQYDNLCELAKKSTIRRKTSVLNIGINEQEVGEPVFPRGKNLHRSQLIGVTGEASDVQSTGVSQLTLLFPGRVCYMKGAHLFSSLAPVLSAHNLKFIIVGKVQKETEEDKLSYESVMKLQQSLPGNVEIRECVYGAEKWALFKSADFILYPSLFEPFGLVPIEAAYAGTPLLSSEVDGMGETIRSSHYECFHIDVSSEEKFAASVETAITSPVEFRHRLALGAYERVKAEYNWSTLAQDYDELFSSLIS